VQAVFLSDSSFGFDESNPYQKADLKTFATKTLRHQEFFYNKPPGVPLCLRAFVAIFTAGSLKFQTSCWNFQ
jgi:hypothetical protein